MIKKLSQIKNLAVFEDFNWDKSIIDNKNNILNFEKINIVYGRNYSGKTTISRIFRSLETGVNLDNNKYENHAYSLELDNGKIITQFTLKDPDLPIIRVFNNDFIRDNLAFIINSNETIKPFAILGEDNRKIEKEIQDLEYELGSNEKEKETGLFLKLKNIFTKLQILEKEYVDEKKSIDKKKQDFVLDRTNGVKYNSNLYGNQNYDVRSLNNDIEMVSSSTYISIDDKKMIELINSLKETEKKDINPLPEKQFLFSDLYTSTEKLTTQKIGDSGKIPELIRETVLNIWVKEGYKLHKNNRSICAFCNNEISEKRWSLLDKHFDEESKKLELDIDSLVIQIEKHKKEVESYYIIDEQLFYTNFHDEIIELKNNMKNAIEKYITNLVYLTNKLVKRKEAITVDFNIEKLDDFSIYVKELLNLYEEKRKKSNEYSEKLISEQKITKDKLRLQKVHEFIATSGYIEKNEKLNEVKNTLELLQQESENINKIIKEKFEIIQDKKRLLNDEEKGAIKVNEYLVNYFGHEFLSLKAIKKENETGEKNIHFEIIRNDKPAFDLSEGECSLIAFCYFMAKLDDVETKGKNPIIWIDDPISSLDSNHIFFIYSLIRSEIIIAENFKQLFISTHNLNFLKYLKRFKKHDEKKGYFMIYRQHKKATFKIMPSYLIDYVTEFNFLFEEIYKCTLIDEKNDDNHIGFYNFGNNARKFLEIYLYYRYPDNTKEMKKMEKFFGKGKIPSLLTDRINNEYSHLSGIFERAATPVEVPEMQKTANFIIETLENKDEEQFCALLNSIGIKYEDYIKRKKIKIINPKQNNVSLFTEDDMIQNNETKEAL